MEVTSKNPFDIYNSKRISYIIATKNRVDKLNESLTSCRKFKGPDDELIIIDGVSKDNTEDIIKRFSDIIDIYVSEPDINDREAWNKGFLLATGKYIKPLPDDDIFYKDALEQAYQVMESNTEVDLIIPGGIRTRDGKWSGRYMYYPPGTNYGSCVDDFYEKGLSVSGCGIFFKRKLFSLVGLWEVDSVSPDHCFLIRSISLGANVKFCRINMYLHDLNSDSVTIKDHKFKYAEVDRIIRTYSSKEFRKKYFRPMLVFERYIGRHRYPNSFPKVYYQNKSIIYRLIRKMIRFIYKPYKILVNKEESIEKTIIEPIWDGGFS
jgi:glycosyltransferase involved in cell wall biosynthesis|tara:strand:- start:1788 stop:2750 length:963 start_codon:yes stop_codon:yes gene_type:complete